MKKILLLLLLPVFSFGQIEVQHYNAGWNDANGVSWVMDLEGCKTIGLTDIAKNPEAKKKYRVRMAPTLIIFKNGVKEIVFKAGLDLVLPVDLKKIQEVINEINNASKF